MSDPFELLGSLREQVSALPYQDSKALDALRRRAEMVIRNIFGNLSRYVKDVSEISFYPIAYPVPEEYSRRDWEDGKSSFLNLISTMEEELKLFGTAAHPFAPRGRSVPNNEVAKPPVLKKGSKDSPKPTVFVVHGHDEEMKQAVARTLTTLGLDPVILHERPNQGRTVIEKFADYADVGFALVLLSPDDQARARVPPDGPLKTRARQNVILELGYFLGRLGREKVVALFRQDLEFEMPSDYSGVIFVPYDPAGRWQFDVLRELKVAGYQVDANKLLPDR
jgi:predicted nucleotide-binding protein